MYTRLHHTSFSQLVDPDKDCPILVEWSQEGRPALWSFGFRNSRSMLVVLLLVHVSYLWTQGQCWRGSGSTAVWFHKGCTSAPVQREDHQTPSVEHNKQEQIFDSVSTSGHVNIWGIIPYNSRLYLLLVRPTYVTTKRRKSQKNNNRSREKHIAHFLFECAFHLSDNVWFSSRYNVGIFFHYKG